MKALIAYYTETNTTKDVADKLTELIADEFDVTTKPIGSIEAVDGYDLVIIGAPIHGMNWVPQAKDFINKFANQLKNTKVAYYFVAYIFKTGGGFWKKAIAKSLDKVNESIQPVLKGKFGGKIDKPFSGFPRLLFGVKKGSPIDVTDWDEVEAFAKELNSVLK